MYEEHASFTAPHRDTKIWRYLNLDKFRLMLEHRAIFFARGDRFADPFEGSLPDLNIKTRERVLRELELDEEDEVIARDLVDTWSLIKRVWRTKVAISCWHQGDTESMAMWRGYGDNGVAVTSTFAALVDSFQAASEQVHIGVVRYEDYALFAVPDWDLFAPFLTKKEPFAYEREVRAIVRNFSPEHEQSQSGADRGIEILVDLETLIGGVHLPPGADREFKDAVVALLVRYGVDRPVSHSTMDAEPLW